MYYVGIGYDNHKFQDNGELIIGGIKIPFPYGIHSHSDGDVLFHALIDALLGATAQGDIGNHFPDNDPQYKNVNSQYLLEKTLLMITSYRIINIDATIILEKPKLAPFLEQIKKNTKKILGPEVQINIKAKSNEGQDSIGQGKSIAAHLICLVKELSFNK